MPFVRSNVPNVIVVLYADDVKVSDVDGVPVKNNKNIQHALDCTYELSVMRQMTVLIAKCTAVHLAVKNPGHTLLLTDACFLSLVKFAILQFLLAMD